VHFERSQTPFERLRSVTWTMSCEREKEKGGYSSVKRMRELSLKYITVCGLKLHARHSERATMLFTILLLLLLRFRL